MTGDLHGMKVGVGGTTSAPTNPVRDDVRSRTCRCYSQEAHGVTDDDGSRRFTELPAVNFSPTSLKRRKTRCA